jgi:hypothetical protein
MMKRRRWSDEQLVAAVARHTNFTDVLRELGLRAAGGNHRAMKVHAERLGVDLRHFSTERRTRGLARRMEAVRIPVDAAFAAGSPVSRSVLRRLAREHFSCEKGCASCHRARRPRRFVRLFRGPRWVGRNDGPSRQYAWSPGPAPLP